MNKPKLATITDINAYRIRHGMPVYTDQITLTEQVEWIDDQQNVDSSNDNAPFFGRLRKHLEIARQSDE